MLDPRSVDLDELCVALVSQYAEMSWWIDPATGEIRPHIPDVDGDETPEEHGWSFIPPGGSHDRYRDMEDFVDAVPDRSSAARKRRRAAALVPVAGRVSPWSGAGIQTDGHARGALRRPAGAAPRPG